MLWKRFLQLQISTLLHRIAPLGLVLGTYIVLDVVWEVLTKNMPISPDTRALMSRYVPIYIGLLIGSCRHRSSAFYFWDCSRCGDWICRLINTYRTRAHCIVSTLSRSTGKGVHHKKSVLFRAISKAKSTNQQERLIIFWGCESEKCGYHFGVKIYNEAPTLSYTTYKLLT